MNLFKIVVAKLKSRYHMILERKTEREIKKLEQSRLQFIERIQQMSSEIQEKINNMENITYFDHLCFRHKK